MGIDRHLGPERATTFWQLVGAYESLVTQYQSDPNGAIDRVNALGHGEAQALLGLSLHALNKARSDDGE